MDELVMVSCSSAATNGLYNILPPFCPLHCPLQYSPQPLYTKLNKFFQQNENQKLETQKFKLGLFFFVPEVGNRIIEINFLSLHSNQRKL
jgi:hypothetical protein